MIAKTESVAVVGMDGHPVDVEVAVTQGLPAFTIVGLPDPSIQEARERVRAAIQSCGETWPLKRVTVNLSPAHLRKAGSSFDLAMALGVLVAEERIAPDRLRGVCVLGELSLDGGVRRIHGVLPAAIAASQEGARALMVPTANAAEASLVSGLDVLPVGHLAQAIAFLRGDGDLDPIVRLASVPNNETGLDLSDVRGNTIAKRALVIAAAGGHNLLMMGPPGGGKTMLARRLPGILPPMTEQESFEVTRVASVAGLLPEGGGLITTRPFRAPHHSASTTGLVGGGSGVPHPGEISLAHRGVLFLDEFAEFRRETLQALRQPLEDGIIRIVRARWAVTYPARFQLIAASNPCPCGFLGDQLKGCSCQPGAKDGYRSRLRGPVIDRIDLQCTVARIKRDELFSQPAGGTSSTIAATVAAARERQRARYRAAGLRSNAEVPPRDIHITCALVPAAQKRVEIAIERQALSARGAHRVIRVARTIADLAAEDDV
ncbi:MAG TPA: YifB family Mg chelatase-like AAA ATPase, partial [Actinomycetota bacterium]|nr:YifB family Mg chelatase-like AAA ATPase [Actinomycetota bacterium]